MLTIALGNGHIEHLTEGELEAKVNSPDILISHRYRSAEYVEQRSCDEDWGTSSQGDSLV